MSQKIPTAIKACYHMIRRYRTCPDFAHVMQMTTSMELIQSAICEYEGKPEMTFEERLADQQQVSHDWRGRTAKMQDEISALERRIDDYRDISDLDSEDLPERRKSEDALDRVQSLMREAEFRGGTVTVEQLADAIAGNHVFF